MVGHFYDEQQIDEVCLSDEVCVYQENNFRINETSLIDSAFDLKHYRYHYFFHHRIEPIYTNDKMC
jgi:hypothetical protein